MPSCNDRNSPDQLYQHHLQIYLPALSHIPITYSRHELIQPNITNKSKDSGHPNYKIWILKKKLD